MADTPQRLAEIEQKLWELLDRYRPEFTDATIYGLPALALPGVKRHDYFAAVKPSTKHVGLYLILADRHPDLVQALSPELVKRRTGKATWSFTHLEQVNQEFAEFLDDLAERYRAEHQ